MMQLFQDRSFARKSRSMDAAGFEARVRDFDGNGLIVVAIQRFVDRRHLTLLDDGRNLKALVENLPGNDGVAQTPSTLRDGTLRSR